MYILQVRLVEANCVTYTVYTATLFPLLFGNPLYLRFKPIHFLGLFFSGESILVISPGYFEHILVPFQSLIYSGVLIVAFFVGARIRRLATHPIEQSWVVSAVQGNNEVNIWDLETGSRRQTLWASNTPPLSQTQVGNN